MDVGSIDVFVRHRKGQKKMVRVEYRYEHTELSSGLVSRACFSLPDTIRYKNQKEGWSSTIVHKQMLVD
jgi:hypothetical protein